MVTSRESILLITADRSLADSLGKLLEGFGYQITVAADADAGLLAARRAVPAVILVDGAGTSLPLFRLEPSLRRIPILAVVYSQEADCETECLKALEKGADGAVCKPVSVKELAARIRAFLRRQSWINSMPGLFEVGRLRVDVGRHEVLIRDKPVDLTKKEFKILQHLAQQPDRVFSRDELLNLVWGEGAALEEHNLDVHVHSLRRKI